MGHSSARRKRSGPMDGDRVLMHDSQGRNSAHLVWSRPAPSLGVGRPAEGRGLGTRHAWPAVQQGGLVISSLCAYMMALLGSADAARHAVATWPSAAVTSVAAGEPGGMGTPGAGLCEVAGIPALLADYVHHDQGELLHYRMGYLKLSPRQKRWLYDRVVSQHRRKWPELLDYETPGGCGADDSNQVGFLVI
mmetsp:Transcript_29540/g.43572  ORF Transcript_29540/g.43572 Transcript_29540/m.43572 type:complete len:192 (-) Transcript_29540:833-1408(-)